MPLTDATINIRNLRLRTYIGFNPEEKVKKQDVVINIRITYAIHESVLKDTVEDALDYKQITKKIISHVEDGHFLLLERLAGDVLDICSEHHGVSYARVEIDKPNALRFADSVSLALEYSADKSRSLKLVEKAS